MIPRYDFAVFENDFGFTDYQFLCDKDGMYVKYKDHIKEIEAVKNRVCEWTRAFDGHFNISCTDETNKRANGNFKGTDNIYAKWEFYYCPYCGGKIEIKSEVK